MREIKFKFYIEDKPSVILTIEDLMGNHDDIDGCFARVQFTGLYDDKNSVELYEGDIVKKNFKQITEIGVVVIKNGNTYIKYSENYTTLISDIKHDIEKIGNIYEHPHLLDSK